MKTISLSQGQVAYVDDEDEPHLSRFKWHAVRHGSTRFVARRSIYLGMGENGKGKYIFTTIPTEILGKKPGCVIDHKNLDSLDNRKANLRYATKQQNNWNRPAKRNNKLRLKGVELLSSGRFRAKIGIDGRLLYLGCFSTAEEAARAYDRAAKKYFGEFAHSNFPEQQNNNNVTEEEG